MKYWLPIFLFLVSCSSGGVSHDYPTDPKDDRMNHAGRMFSKNNEELAIFGPKNSEKTKAKKDVKSLWDATLRTISKYFPLRVVDADSGLITTDYGQFNDDKYRLNVVVGDDFVDISAFSSTGTRSNSLEEELMGEINRILDE